MYINIQMEKKLTELENYIKYVNEKNDDEMTEIIAKLINLEQKIARFAVRETKSLIEKKYKETYEKAKEENAQESNMGSIRIGKLMTTADKGRKTPITYGFINIVAVAGPGNAVGRELDAAHLKYDGKIMQNIWEFSKVYPIHMDNDKVKPEFWQWQETGLKVTYAIKYPFGMAAYGDHVGFMHDKEFITEAEARRKIYAPIYKKILQKTEDYKKLQEMLADGYNLQLCDFQAVGGSYLTKGVYGEDKAGSMQINADIVEKVLYDRYEVGAVFYLAAFLLELL